MAAKTSNVVLLIVVLVSSTIVMSVPVKNFSYTTPTAFDTVPLGPPWQIYLCTVSHPAGQGNFYLRLKEDSKGNNNAIEGG